jgi:hypothetical protein
MRCGRAFDRTEADRIRKPGKFKAVTNQRASPNAVSFINASHNQDVKGLGKKRKNAAMLNVR